MATEAVCAIRDYAINARHLPKLIAIVDPENIASLRVVENSAFHYEREVMFDGYTHPDRVFAFKPT